MSAIPSQSAPLLRALIGRRIVSIMRYSWWPPQIAQQKCGGPAQSVFSMTLGPVALALDTGVVLGIANHPSLRSICVWMEIDADGQALRTHPMASDEELHPISSTDPTFANPFWRRALGARIEGLSIYVRPAAGVKAAMLPNEVGLRFALDSGVSAVAIHGLQNDSARFSFVPDHWIDDELRAQLEERPLP